MTPLAWLNCSLILDKQGAFWSDTFDVAPTARSESSSCFLLLEKVLFLYTSVSEVPEAIGGLGRGGGGKNCDLFENFGGGGPGIL
mmetsp:Transcript_15079/g.25758  ORF Transcript_15079/g.25758 Transcript_15079/m.25758 type:complete len:85 (-) Transcript_15079:251-505(-)